MISMINKKRLTIIFLIANAFVYGQTIDSKHITEIISLSFINKNELEI